MDWLLGTSINNYHETVCVRTWHKFNFCKGHLGNHYDVDWVHSSLDVAHISIRISLLISLTCFNSHHLSDTLFFRIRLETLGDAAFPATRLAAPHFRRWWPIVAIAGPENPEPSGRVCPHHPTWHTAGLGDLIHGAWISLDIIIFKKVNPTSINYIYTLHYTSAHMDKKNIDVLLLPYTNFKGRIPCVCHTMRIQAHDMSKQETLYN